MFIFICVSVCAHVVLTLCSPVPVSALAPGMGVAVYAGLVGALLLCVILVLCVGVLAYRRRCRHLHGDITDSSSALTAAFHPGNYKPPRQGTLMHTHTQTHSPHRFYLSACVYFHYYSSFHPSSWKQDRTVYFIITFLFISPHEGLLFILLSLLPYSTFHSLLHYTFFLHLKAFVMPSLILGIKY